MLATLLSPFTAFLSGCISFSVVPPKIDTLGNPVYVRYVCLEVNHDATANDVLPMIEDSLRRRGIQYGLWNTGTMPAGCDAVLTYRIVPLYSVSTGIAEKVRIELRANTNFSRTVETSAELTPSRINRSLIDRSMVRMFVE